MYLRMHRSTLLALLAPISAAVLIAGQPQDFVDLRTVVPNVVLDLRYATEDNFTHHRVYDNAVCLVRRSTAEKLARVQDDLRAGGLRLKVYDCYRPLSVQKRFWALVPDERYVANPTKGSRHNRGAALDLTLFRAGDSKTLDMGTEFDDFTERAHRDYTNLPSTVLANRRKLKDAMVRRGFIGLPTEWWHFDDADWERYPLEDLPVEPITKTGAIR